MIGLFRKPKRVERLDGSKRSLPPSESRWRGVMQRERVLRVAFVAAVTLAVALVAILRGPPFPYRVGEVYPYDIRPRVPFELVDQLEKAQQSSRADQADRQPAEPSIETGTALESYPVNKPLVSRNTPITLRQLAVLKEEHQAWLHQLTIADHFRRAASLTFFFGLIALLVSLYVVRYQPAVYRTWRSLISVSVLTLATVALAVIVSPPPWEAMILPLTLSMMLVAVAYNPQFAVVLGFAISLVLALTLGLEVPDLLVILSGLTALGIVSRNVCSRTQLIRAGAVAATTFGAATIAAGWMMQQPWGLILADAGKNLVWGLLSGFLLTGMLPLVERLFGVMTDISLREYADGSHPLLRELLQRAPGTYTHSMAVGTLSEAAAQTLGVNALLVRVGSYFHDIGKMLKPEYFVENQSGENRHDSLEPALSTLIIIGHVKDGIALAKQYNLPEPIVDFIAQHHGTTLVEYFYREALKSHEQNGNGKPNGEFEASFRYPGPKPQTREVAIVMLADAVESASRSLAEPTPARIRKLVHDLVMKRLLDGQLDESGLTLTELRLIEESLCKGLTAAYHARVKYSRDEAEAEGKAGAKAS